MLGVAVSMSYGSLHSVGVRCLSSSEGLGFVINVTGQVFQQEFRVGRNQVFGLQR